MKEITYKLSPRKSVLLDDIDGHDERFQTRHHEFLRSSTKYRAKDNSLENIKGLMAELERVIENNKKNPRLQHLDPITVWKPEDNDKYIIVAGFHRYRAYVGHNKKQTKASSKKRTIAAHIFQGSEPEAELFSANQDIRPQLAKSREEKANEAWKLVREENSAAEQLTARQLADRCGVSKSLISKMRTTHRKLKETGGVGHDQWRIQLLADKAKQPMNDGDRMTALIDSISSKAIQQTLKRDCKSDRQLFKEVLKEIARRTMKDPDEELEQLLGIDVTDEESDF